MHTPDIFKPGAGERSADWTPYPVRDGWACPQCYGQEGRTLHNIIDGYVESEAFECRRCGNSMEPAEVCTGCTEVRERCDCAED